MSIIGVQNWEIIQQKNGFGKFVIHYEASGWLKNPVTSEEIRVSKLWKKVKAKVFEEDTGREVIKPVETEDIKDKKCVFKVENIPLGGLYTLEISLVFENEDGSTFTYGGGRVRHFGVGDLFLVAGQSNAAGWSTGGYNDGGELGIHNYKDGIWDLATHPLGGAYMGPFLSFAKYLKHKLNYPIGLISRAVGGSPISTWIKGGVHTENLRKENIQDIKAILWYQGCADAEKIENAEIYESQFYNFYDEMKVIFKNVPMITFQINRLRNQEFWKEEGFNLVREIQRKISLKEENIFLIPTIDLTNMSDQIHNGCSDNILLGHRTAKLVLDKIYAKEKNYEAPTLKNIKIVNDNEVEISFNNVVDTLVFYGTKDEMYPIKILNSIIKEFTVKKDIVNVICEEKLPKDIYISINSGINPQSILVDAVSKLPVISVYNYKV